MDRPFVLTQRGEPMARPYMSRCGRAASANITVLDSRSGNGRIVMPDNRRIGKRGEKLAQNYLRRQGYAIIDSNWSCLEGELDIVARQADMLVFVEVKTRRDSSTEAALASITPSKRERLLRAAWRYLHDHDIDSDAPWRLDVIAVALDGRNSSRIAHVEDAFDW